MKVILLRLILLTLIFSPIGDSKVANAICSKCVGAKVCKACRNCKACKHCNKINKGTCGVCVK